MPKRVIHEAVTERLEILDKDGVADEQLLPPLSDTQLVRLYRDMALIRKFDEKALSMQRQGRMGTFGSLRGQEAAQAGLAMAMGPGDWLVPSFREHGLMLLRGLPGHLVYAYWKGDERGSRFPDGTRCLPCAVPVGSQLLHATGLGMALKLKGEDAVAVGCAGDGASSEGDFHEALNFAGVFKARTLFFIQNNQWAISVPFKKQTAAASIAQRAHAYGIGGLQVDGNDVLAVYAAASDALARIRRGEGPFLLEALTYRMESHTTADDAFKYRPKDEVEYWRDRDPIERMEKFLAGRGLWDEALESEVLEGASASVEAAVAELEAMPKPRPEDIFDYHYHELPWNLKEQRESLLKEVGA